MLKKIAFLSAVTSLIAFNTAHAAVDLGLNYATAIGGDCGLKPITFTSVAPPVLYALSFFAVVILVFNALVFALMSRRVKPAAPVTPSIPGQPQPAPVAPIKKPWLKRYLLISGIMIALAGGALTSLVIYSQLHPQCGLEEEGKLKIKELQETQALIQEYGEENVTVKAADLDEPGEATFMPKIDPGFKDQPGCVIVVEGPGGGTVYQLDEEFNIVHQISLRQFRERGNTALGEEFMSEFFEHLK